ncbi:MAG: hypothetical protein ACHQ4H_08085 [Ktedonobacterales bacterium]
MSNPNGAPNGPLGGVEQQAEQQAEQHVDSVIDELASKIPGGNRFSQQAKQKANEEVVNLAHEAENQGSRRLGGLGDKLGGLLGGGGSHGGNA